MAFCLVFIACGIIRGVDEDKLQDVSLNLLPAAQILVIVIAIMTSLLQLRIYHSKHKTKVDKTKVWSHFFICILLFVVYIVDFFRLQKLCLILNPPDPDVDWSINDAHE